MKKIVALLLATVMVFALCACGGTSEAGNGATVQEEIVSDDVENTARDDAENSAPDNVENTAPDNEENTTPDDVENVAPDDTDSAAEEEKPAIIEFTDVVLVDDDTVRIELVNFYEQEYNWNTGKQIEKCLTYKVTNKSDHELLIYLEDPYIDDESVSRSGVDGVGNAPKPGKTASYRYRIYYNSPADKNGKALDSLDDLYRLEATFEIMTKIDNKIVGSYDAVFSLPAIFSGEQVAAESEPAVMYQVGDTVSTDILEFTLTGFDYVYHLDPKTYSEKADNSGGSIGPGKDMVFANPEYSIKNIAKESIKSVEVVVFSVDYNDGYKYGMSDGNMCYIVDAPGVLWKWADKGVGQGASMTISPLSSETYQAYIPANALIDTDTESPLLLLVTLATSSGTKDFVFQIR